MERLTTARCDDCGYVEENLVVGGYGAAGSSGERWPCLCFSCRRIVSALINWETLACRCGSTDVEPYGSISPPWSGGGLLHLADRAIEDQGYVCPRCGAIALRFTPGAILSD